MPAADTRDLDDERPLSIVLELGRGHAPDDPFAFRFAPQDYTVRAPAGPRVFRIEWSETLLAELAALRSPDPERAQRIGATLQRALRATHWPELARQIVDASARGRDVHVTLRSSAAELYALPWELLTVGSTGQHLGEIERVVLRYEWPGTDTSPEDPSPRPEGGRALVAWSAAGGELPQQDHVDAVAEAYREAHVGFDPDRDVLADASASAIVEALEGAARDGAPYAILHLLCHGGQVGSNFGLVLGTHESPQVEDAGRLRQLLAPYAGTLRLVVLSACDSGNTGAPGNHLGSVAQALHRAGVQAVVASRFPLSVPGSTVLARALYRGLLVERRSLERSIAAARRQLARETRGLDWASVQLYARERDGDDTRPVVLRPFRGLEVFEAQHRRLFFGRHAEADEAVREIEALARSDAPRMFFIVGASGSGKSSLVRAAVVPRLRARFEAVHITRPSTPLNESLPSARPLLLVLDQSEELFTSLDEAVRDALTRRLHGLATDVAGSVVLFTLRADFIGHCGQIVLPGGGRLDQLESRDEHRVYLPVMSREGMLETITGPARLAGLRLEAGLAEQLVDEVFGEPGSLPLLEFALDQMWRARDPVRGLTHEVYRALGGAVGALLEREADAVIEAMDDEGRDAARTLLVQLVATGEGQRADTRRIRRLAELRPREAETFDAVLARLTTARLVVTSGAEEARVEIAHEELIRRWGTLRAWVDADRQMLAELAKLEAWVKQWREHGALLRGAQLGYAKEIIASNNLVNDEIHAFVRRSAAAARRSTWGFWALVSFAAAVLLALGAGVWFYRNYISPKQEADTARLLGEVDLLAQNASAPKTSERREHVILTAAAMSVHAERHETALALLRELGSVSPRLEFRAWEPLVRSASERLAPAPLELQTLRDRLDTMRSTPAVFVHPGLAATALSPNGRELIIGSTCNDLSVLDSETGAELRRLSPHRSSAAWGHHSSVRMHKDGRVEAVCYDSLFSWAPRGDAPPSHTELELPERGLFDRVVLSDDSLRFIKFDQELRFYEYLVSGALFRLDGVAPVYGTARVLDLRTRAASELCDRCVVDALSTDGTTGLFSRFGLHLVDLASAKTRQLECTENFRPYYGGSALSDGGRRVLLLDQSGRVVLIDTGSCTSVAAARHEQFPAEISLSADGSRALSIAYTYDENGLRLDPTTYVWSPDEGGADVVRAMWALPLECPSASLREELLLQRPPQARQDVTCCEAMRACTRAASDSTWDECDRSYRKHLKSGCVDWSPAPR